MSAERRIFEPSDTSQINYFYFCSNFDNQKRKKLHGNELSVNWAIEKLNWTYIRWILYKVRATAALVDSIGEDSSIDCDLCLIHQVTEVRIIYERNKALEKTTQATMIHRNFQLSYQVMQINLSSVDWVDRRRKKHRRQWGGEGDCPVITKLSTNFRRCTLMPSSSSLPLICPLI